MAKKKKALTLDTLAIMVSKGFADTATKRDIADMATKRDIADMATKRDIATLEDRIEEIAERLGRVEAKLDRALYKEVARLEDLIRQLARKVRVKLEY